MKLFANSLNCRAKEWIYMDFCLKKRIFAN